MAKDKQCNFFAEPIPFFGNIDYGKTEQLSPDAIRTSMFGDFDYDYHFLLKTDKDIIIDSFVQKADLLVKNRDFLCDMFSCKQIIDLLPEPDELVIHIRETDYKAINVYLGDDIYKDIIRKYNFAKNTIVTDNINSELIKELVQNYNCSVFTKQMSVDWRYPYFSENELNDFNYIKHSKNIFISQSTFSWWAAFLNKEANVIVPYRSDNNGIWKLIPTAGDIDLHTNISNWKKHIY